MPLIKRKPVIAYPLPSLSTVLQPLPSNATAEHAGPSPDPASPHKGGKGKAAAPPADLEDASVLPPMPADGNDDEVQLEKLLTVFRGDFVDGATTAKGRKPGTTILTGQLFANGHGEESKEGNGEGSSGSYRIHDRECWYIPETGEIFTDYESYSSRRAFYAQPIFQCEVTGKSSLSYFGALQNEQKEVRQLHSRFPRQLKKAVLSAVQFQIEGKLDTLADKIFERYVNRFFDDEKVFIDVEGDKYLARIVKTFPPKSLSSAPSSPLKSLNGATQTPTHPLAMDLSLTMEEVNENDDPMRYFYSVRLIQEGAAEGIPTEYSTSSVNGQSPGPEDEGKGEKWGSSVMEVQADKISRDRINFSRAMLKRFIRDCVDRGTAVYSPWTVKPAVAKRYGIPHEMTDEIRESIARYKERQMDKRKREREERLGITHPTASEIAAEEAEKEKEKEKEKERPKTKKQRLAEERAAREAEKAAEEEGKKKKPMKFPAEDLLLDFSPEKDGAAGRLEVRPTPGRTLPFGDQFERFLMTWSFLNVMGKPLGLSPFPLDDFEQSLYHNDPWTSPAPLMTEVHATLINVLIRDLTSGAEPVRPLASSGLPKDENDGDYWEGTKGATTETLRPIAAPLAESWKSRELSARDGRKGWEAALVGCLWERASIDTLPEYLDHVLHLTFEDKPAPTRPTWSTGPSQTSGHGLIPAKPEKRYSTLHHTHKLSIIAFLVELAAQTEAIREFMDESTSALTDVRKEQAELKREIRRLQAERDALEPKEKPEEEANGEADAQTGGVDANGDVSMEGVKEERAASPDLAVNGHTLANGNGSGSRDEDMDSEQDELEDSPEADDMSSAMQSSPPASERGPKYGGAARRNAMAAKAAERAEEEAQRNAQVASARAEAKAKRAESAHVTAEKRRLLDEEEAAVTKLHALEHDFRSYQYTLRSRPMGSDRFGNKLWWMDGLGSAPLISDTGRPVLGTGRIYLQGADPVELEMCRVLAELSAEECDARRAKEEGEGRLEPGEWGVYDTPEQLGEYMRWLNPKGIRELALLKLLRQWEGDIEAGMRRRRVLAGLETAPDDEPARKIRSTRRGAQGDEERDGYMNWKNRRA